MAHGDGNWVGKACAKCHVSRPIDQYRVRRDTGKPKAICKPCIKVSDHERYLVQRDSRSANAKLYRLANKDTAAIYNRAYREANRDRLSAQKRAYYEANREQLAEKQNAWREANLERSIEANRAWHLANPEKTRAAGLRYARKSRDELSDNYIRVALRLPAALAPAALLAAKRAQIMVKRKIKELA